MQIKSNTVTVDAPIDAVFQFLSDTRNIHHLMPHDKISDWQADELNCSFKVQGGIIISFKQTETAPPNTIHLKSGERAPFPFSLTVHLEKENETQTSGHLFFDGVVNMFVKMMVEGPLEHLFNTMAAKLKEHYTQS